MLKDYAADEIHLNGSAAAYAAAELRRSLGIPV
jgi:hypothetical protein